MLEEIADVIAAGENPKDPATMMRRGIRPDLNKRGSLRTVFDGRYKFSRYFAPIQRNRPANVSELYLNNDVELFDFETDPQEMTNLAANKDAHRDLVLAMSDKLEHAIKDEIGRDDGREMPDFKGVSWAMDSVD